MQFFCNFIKTIFSCNRATSFILCIDQENSEDSRKCVFEELSTDFIIGWVGFGGPPALLFLLNISVSVFFFYE